MAKRKTLEDLKQDLLDLQNEIKIRENDLKNSIGAAVLSQFEVNSVSEFLEKYKIVRVEPKREVKKDV